MEQIKTIFDFIITAGAIQGIFLALILFTVKTGNKGANRILAFLLLTFSASIFHILVFNIFKLHMPSGKEIGEPFQLLFGPLFYFYVKKLTNRDFGFSKRHLLHGLPFIISSIFAFPIYRHLLSVDDLVSRIANVSLWLILLIHIWTYLIVSLKIVHRHAKVIKENFSNIEKINLEWVGFFIRCLFAAYALYAVLMPILVHSPDPATHFNKMVTIILAVLIYGLGYRGLIQPQIFTGKSSVPAIDSKNNNEAGEKQKDQAVEEKQNKQEKQETLKEKENISMRTAEQSAKYAKSSLSGQALQEGFENIKNIMEKQRLFIDPEFTLNDLAEKTGYSVHNISQIINSSGRNFYDFVNFYRVEEVKQYLCDPEKTKKHTILSLAFDAGFNSKAAFNKIFKNLTGQTPSQYKKSRTTSA